MDGVADAVVDAVGRVLAGVALLGVRGMVMVLCGASWFVVSYQ